MQKQQTVTLEMIYNEIKSMREELSIVEHALVPTVKLSAEELEEYKKDLKEALSEECTDHRQLKR